MIIQHDAHWIADDSDDEHSSGGNWSVEEIYDDKEAPSSSVNGCQWHHLEDAADNTGKRTGYRPGNALDDPEGDFMSEGSNNSDENFHPEQDGPPLPTLWASAPQEVSADFIPDAKFGGARSGYHFKKGEKGLGYYKECPVVITVADEVSPGLGDPITLALDDLFCWNPDPAHVMNDPLYCGFARTMELFHRSSLLYAHAALLWHGIQMPLTGGASPCRP